MVKFEKYNKPASPNGTSLFLIYFVYICLSITYSYNEELGIKIDNQQLIFSILVALSFPFLFWPLVNDQEFTKAYLPSALKPKMEDNAVKNFAKKFFGGYYIGLTFPFLKFKQYVFNSKDDSELKKYKYKQYFNYYILPILGFIILLAAIGIAIFFNERVINARNSVGIYLMGPGERTIYQIIFSLLLMTIFFSLIPNKMAASLDKTWNYYLMFAFSVINLIIINEKMNDKDTFDQKSLSAVYAITIVLMLYSVYNLIYLSTESKDYRILTLGKLDDEDRININAELFGIYDALKQIKNSDKQYFSEDYFDADLAKNKFKGSIDSSVFDSLAGNTRPGLEVTMKSIDQTFINIYQARMSWEKSLRRYFKTDDMKDKKEILNGFFASEDFERLTKTSSKTFNNSAVEFRKAWYTSRETNQLPDGDASRKIFGAATTVIGGNIAMGLVSSNILKDFSMDISEDISLLFNRYMFQELAEQFVKVTNFFRDFKIYSLNASFVTSGGSDITGSKADDITTIKITKEFYVNFNDMLFNLVNANKNIRNKTTEFNRNLNIFQTALNNFQNKDSFNKNEILGEEIYNYYSELSYRISILIAIYNYNVTNGTEDEKREFLNKFKDDIEKLYDISKNAMQILFNKYRDDRSVPVLLITRNFRRDLEGDETLSPPGDVINITQLITGTAGGTVNIDLTTRDARASYKVIKPLTSTNDTLTAANVVDDLKDKLGTPGNDFLTLPEMLFSKDLINYNNNRFQNAYKNVLIVYSQLIMSIFTKLVNNQSGINASLLDIKSRNTSSDEINTLRNETQTIIDITAKTFEEGDITRSRELSLYKDFKNNKSISIPLTINTNQEQIFRGIQIIENFNNEINNTNTNINGIKNVLETEKKKYEEKTNKNKKIIDFLKISKEEYIPNIKGNLIGIRDILGDIDPNDLKLYSAYTSNIIEKVAEVSDLVNVITNQINDIENLPEDTDYQIGTYFGEFKRIFNEEKDTIKNSADALLDFLRDKATNDYPLNTNELDNLKDNNNNIIRANEKIEKTLTNNIPDVDNINNELLKNLRNIFIDNFKEVKEIVNEEIPKLEESAGRGVVLTGNKYPMINGRPVIANNGTIARYDVYLKTDNQTNLNNFLNDYSKLEKLSRNFDKEYSARKGIVSNTLSKILTSKEAIETDIKFFKEVAKFPPANIDLNNLKNEIPYEYVLNDNKKLNVDPNLIKNMKEYYNTVKNSGVIIDSSYSNLTTKQKNTIIATERFKEIYKFYFPGKEITSGDDLRNVYNKFKNIYDSYNECLIAYLVASVESGRFKNERNVSIKLKSLLETINQGFPEEFASNNKIYRKGDLTQTVNFGQLQAAEYTEVYKDKLGEKAIKERINKENIERAKKLEKSMAEEAQIVTNEKNLIFRTVVEYLTKGTDGTISLSGKNILKINFIRKKEELGGFNVDNKFLGEVYNVFTKLMLSVLQYANNFNGIDYNQYVGNKGDTFSIVPFLTAFLANFYMAVTPDNKNDGIVRTSASLLFDRFINVLADKDLNNNNSKIFLQTEGGGGPTQDENQSALNFLSVNDAIKIDLPEYKNNKDNINEALNEIEKNLNSNLSTFIYGVVSDDNISSFTSNKNKNMKKIIDSSTKNDNIYYHMLIRIIKEKTTAPIIDTLNLSGGPLNYKNYLENFTKKLDADDLVKILETDFGKRLKDNEGDPQGTLIKTIIENPIINSLKNISRV